MPSTAELVELVETLAAALRVAETELRALDDPEFPLEVDLPDDVVKRLKQLDAFVATVKTFPEDVQKGFRERYRERLAQTKTPQGVTTDIRVPVSGDALRELDGLYELLRAWTIRAPELRDALGALREAW